mmetsp:Transcript_23119/g.64094  ORF Transcript_23119/g.64094 Transcript_23119/m.64094 type:complete len:626 (-) Transcript_23119:533-2410(-)
MMQAFFVALFTFAVGGIQVSRVGSSVAFAEAESSDKYKKKKTTRIAVIGGGISGSFLTKYLTEYDIDCGLDITVFDPPPSSSDDDNHVYSGSFNQGSRVSSHRLKDGTVVERGASILFGGNKLVNDMIDGSSNDHDESERLVKIKPHGGGGTKGLGIYDGHSGNRDKASLFPLWMLNTTESEAKSYMIWRYNLDLWRINTAALAAVESFGKIYDLLDDHTNMDTFFESPNDIWERVGLSHEASVSFDEYLDGIGVSSYIAWWRRWFLESMAEQGPVRSEFYAAMNICNNNQLNSQMTGLGGLVNAIAGTGELFAIEGGNDKLISSAFRQADRFRDETCSSESDNKKIRRLPIKIQTLVSSDFQVQQIELFGEDGKLVDPRPYDIVVVATPLQFSGIEFMGKGTVFDDGVLYYLPLNDMVDSDNSDANIHEHVHSLGGEHHLPSSAKRRYTKVVTTFVSHAKLQPSYFHLDENDESGDDFPRAILFTEQGRKQSGLSSIGRITKDVYKTFSSSELSAETVKELFGNDAVVEDTKVWGGPRGGATPSFNGGGESARSTRFLLYSGGRKEENGEFLKTTSAIYYTNAMESAVSAVEISAIGSKSVAKLIARRVGLVDPNAGRTTGDEL